MNRVGRQRNHGPGSIGRKRSRRPRRPGWVLTDSLFLRWLAQLGYLTWYQRLYYTVTAWYYFSVNRYGYRRVIVPVRVAVDPNPAFLVPPIGPSATRSLVRRPPS